MLSFHRPIDIEIMAAGVAAGVAVMEEVPGVC